MGRRKSNRKRFRRGAAAQPSAPTAGPTAPALQQPQVTSRTATSTATCSTGAVARTNPPFGRQEVADKPKGRRLGDLFHFMSKMYVVTAGCRTCKPGGGGQGGDGDQGGDGGQGGDGSQGGGGLGRGGQGGGDEGSADYVFVRELLDGFDSRLVFHCETCGDEIVVQISRPRSWGETRTALPINDVLVLRAATTGQGFEGLQQLADRLGHPCMPRMEYHRLVAELRQVCAPDDLPASPPDLPLEEGFDILKL